MCGITHTYKKQKHKKPKQYVRSQHDIDSKGRVMNYFFRANIQSMLQLGQEVEAGNRPPPERGEGGGRVVITLNERRLKFLYYQSRQIKLLHVKSEPL